MTNLHPRDPWVFDTRVLGRRAGTMAELQRDVAVSEEMGTDVIAVRAGEAVSLDARFESVLEGVLASGTARSLARGACVRCLDDVALPVEASFQELFAYADRAAHHQQVGDEDEDRFVLEGDLLSLEPVVRDAVVLQLPFQPVCRPDCPGLCVECGQHLADDPEHGHDSIDPRWASLQALASGGSQQSPASQNAEEKRN